MKPAKHGHSISGYRCQECRIKKAALQRNHRAKRKQETINAGEEKEEG